MTNQEIADNYLNWFSQHYTELKWKFCKFCQENHYDFDEDVFSDTYLKIYDTIAKKGLKDNSPKGYSGYTFIAFKNNIRLEKVYLREKKRDYNVNSQQLQELYEQYYNEHNDTAKAKLLKDLWIDYATLYILLTVEQNFDSEHFYLYKLKVLEKNMTFKKLAEKCKDIKATRRKVLEVMRFVKENIKKEDIRKSFFENYGNLI